MISEVNKLLASESLSYCNALLIDKTPGVSGFDIFFCIYIGVIFVVLLIFLILFAYKYDKFKAFIKHKNLNKEYNEWKKIQF